MSQDCVTLASITSRKRAGVISVILATSFLPDATTRMSRRPNRATAPSTIFWQASSELGPQVQRLDLGAERAAALRDRIELGLLARRQHQSATGAGENLCSHGAESPGSAGDDRDPAFDVEERKRVLQKLWAHGLVPGG